MNKTSLPWIISISFTNYKWKYKALFAGSTLKCVLFIMHAALKLNGNSCLEAIQNPETETQVKQNKMKRNN